MAGIDKKSIESEIYEPGSDFRTFAEALSKVSKALVGLDDLLEPVRRSYGPDDRMTKSLSQLAAGAAEALKFARKAQAAIAEHRLNGALQSALELIRTVNLQINVPEVHDDVAEDLGVLVQDTKSLQEVEDGLDEAVRGLDYALTEVIERTDDLLNVAIEIMSDFANMARPAMHPANEQPAAEAIRDLAVMMASFQAGSARPAETSRASGRFETVSEQMMATLDVMGLPHEGVQFGHIDKVELARTRLVDGLMRNFAWKERDGFRVYYRTDAAPELRNTADPSQLLRGDAFVNAQMLSTDANALNATIARLPAMNRFETVRGLFDPASMRRRIKDELDALVETARDPLGINLARARYQFRRVIRTILEYLELGEIHTVANWQRCFTSDDVRDLIKELVHVIENDLAAPVSAVREEEVAAELRAVFSLLCSIGRRIVSVQEGAQRGVNSARLELALTATLSAAVALEDQLERTGTDPIEQDLVLVPAQGGEGGAPPSLSLGQFLGWVRAVAEPFSRPENKAASLHAGDLKILRCELRSLRQAAEQFVSGAGSLSFSVRLPGPMRQLVELKYLLDKALNAADAMAAALTIEKA
ncbi:hypothetical protein [Ensifer adhaerens]|uniref:hypothetical protein n=1 Tax=Ensifer adhaerens TaxID=106592 RepID=UPI00098FB77A|nr:hypothetical protein [Ensifer adhaerens]